MPSRRNFLIDVLIKRTGFVGENMSIYVCIMGSNWAMALRLLNAKCSGQHYSLVSQTLLSEIQPGLEIKKPKIWWFLFLEQSFLYNENDPVTTTVAFYPIIINICGPSKNTCICVTLSGHGGEKTYNNLQMLKNPNQRGQQSVRWPKRNAAFRHAPHVCAQSNKSVLHLLL